MTPLSFLDYLPLWGVFLTTLAGIALAMEIGYRLGTWRHQRCQSERDAPVSALTAATLGLVGFMLATTFGIAVARFDLRLNTFLNEVDAIGTALLRSDFLPEPIRNDVRTVLRDYIDTRLAGADPHHLHTSMVRSEELHKKLWNLTVASERQTQNPVATGLFIQSVNEIIDLHTRRIIAAVGARIPAIVWLTLYAVAVIGLGELGYQAALAGSARSPAAIGLILSFTIVISIIVDLDRPFEGRLKVNQGPMWELRRSFE